jgi:glycosyltransferase involved in cell wall biosynthesis
MRPYLSVIIPHYNNPHALERLLVSLTKSKRSGHFEVIVVDDGSSADNRATVRSLIPALQKKIRTSNARIHGVFLSHNRGPAVARNRGAKIAKGKFLVFMDCDVEAFPDTLARITAIYGDDPDIVALTGVWVKEQRTRAFFPNFKALRDWSYWINERDKSGYYFLFSTRIASIKKTVFQRLGGFDEEYNAPLVEDIELTYRIARRYAIIFAPDVRVRHEFEDFWPIAKKYFLRAFYWTRLYRRRKRFDPVATTLQEAMTSISGVGILVLGALAVLGVFMTAGVMTKPLMAMVIVWAFTFAAHVFLVRRFLYFVYQEKGFSFMMKSIFIGLVLYCIIFAGALAGQIRTTDSNTK